MAWTPQELTARHQEIIRLTFIGRTPIEIAGQLGLDAATIRLIVNSPLAQAELGRLTAKAEESITDVPRRVRLMEMLEDAGEEAIQINRDLMKDQNFDYKGRPFVPARVKASIGKHFIDRGIVGITDQQGEGSIREILRSLERIEQVMSTPEPVQVMNVQINNGDGVPKDV